MRLPAVVVFCLLISGTLSCQNACRYPLDDSPQIKIDTTLLGVWRANEAIFNDYFLVQSFDDMYRDIPEQYRNDSTMLAERKYKDYLYYITEVDTGKGEVNMIAFASTVNNTTIINLGNHTPLRMRNLKHFARQGQAYVFMKLKAMGNATNKMVLIPYADTAMSGIKSPAEIRKRITSRINSKLYFGDSAVFTKVSNDHWNKRKY